MIRNPATGRMVKANGRIGKMIQQSGGDYKGRCKNRHDSNKLSPNGYRQYTHYK